MLVYHEKFLNGFNSIQKGKRDPWIPLITFLCPAILDFYVVWEGKAGSLVSISLYSWFLETSHPYNIPGGIVKLFTLLAFLKKDRHL